MFRSLNVLALSAVLLVAGCGTSAAESPAAPATSAPAATADTRDPVSVVKDSFQRSFDAKTFVMTATIEAGPQTMEMSADVDLAAGAMRISMDAPEPMEIVKIGNEMFIKSGKLSGDKGKPYLRIEIDKLNESSALRESLNLAGQSGILGGVTTAEKRSEAGGSVTYEGLADLKKATEVAPESTRASMEPLARLATNASAVPYVATIDAQGRLTKLEYTVDTSVAKMVSTVALTALGEPVTLDRPAPGDVQDATDEQYAFF